jgi:hypothetical protein
MDHGLVFYNGAAYRVPAIALAELLARGVIVRDQLDEGYELAPDQLIEELESLSTVVERRSGEEARGETDDIGKLRMLALRYQHRDGQGTR